MANIIIPSLLQSFTDGKSRVEVPGKTLRQAIENLDEISPGFAERLLDEDGQLVPEILASIDGETAHLGLRQGLAENSEVAFVPAIGGG